MFSLDDLQLETVMTAAADPPTEKRSVFLERIAAYLRLRDRPLVLADEFEKVVRLAMTGLLQQTSKI